MPNYRKNIHAYVHALMNANRSTSVCIRLKFNLNPKNIDGQNVV